MNAFLLLISFNEKQKTQNQNNKFYKKCSFIKKFKIKASFNIVNYVKSGQRNKMSVRSVRGITKGPSKMPPLKPKQQAAIPQPSPPDSANSQIKTPKSAKTITVKPKQPKPKAPEDEDIWAKSEREFKECCDEFGFNFDDQETKVDWLREMDKDEDELVINFIQDNFVPSDYGLVAEEALSTVEYVDDPVEYQNRLHEALSKRLTEIAHKTKEIAEKRKEILDKITQDIMSHPASEYNADTIPDPEEDVKDKRPKSEPKGKANPRTIRQLKK